MFAAGPDIFQQFRGLGILVALDQELRQADLRRFQTRIDLKCLAIELLGFGGVGFLDLDRFVDMFLRVARGQTIEKLVEFRFGQDADKIQNRLAVAEGDDGRQGIDVVLHRQAFLLVSIDLGQQHGAVALGD